VARPFCPKTCDACEGEGAATEADGVVTGPHATAHAVFTNPAQDRR
jgi:hypothetical protein